MNRSKDNNSKLNSVFYAHTYHPIQAGSIDYTDVLPHDNAVYRALLCSSAGLYDLLGDPSVIGEDPYCTLFVGRLSHLTTEDTRRQGRGDLNILVIIHMALPVDHKANIIDGKLIAQTIRAEIASEVCNLVEKYGKGCIELLKRSGVTIKGKRAVVVGRSNIVGLPVSLLLLKEDATVTVVHSRTADPQSIICESDIVIAAAGQAMMSVPLWKVEFSKSKEGEYLKEEVEDGVKVLQQGHSMFTEVENSLKKLENVFSGSMLQLQGSCKKLI